MRNNRKSITTEFTHRAARSRLTWTVATMVVFLLLVSQVQHSETLPEEMLPAIELSHERADVSVLTMLTGHAMVDMGPTPTITTVRSGNWNDASVWSAGRVPTANDVVAIKPNHKINLNTNAIIKRLAIQGTLNFSYTQSTTLEIAGNLVVEAGGRLIIGTPDNPIPANVKHTVIFDANDNSEFQGTVGFDETDTGLWVMQGGIWESHGAPVEFTWTKLAQTANAGSNKVVAQGDLTDWPIGSDVVITATGSEPREVDGNVVSEDELRKVTATRAIGGGLTELILSAPLTHTHSGSGEARGEIALLSRNIMITSKDEDRAHTMFMHGASGGLSYTLFKKLGVTQTYKDHLGRTRTRGVLGRYPIHFHKMETHAIGMTLRGNSVWDSAQNGIVLHSSLGVLVEDTVMYDIRGIGYWLEHDKVRPESDTNVFIRNIGIFVKPADTRDSVFWADRGNHFIDNVAVSMYDTSDGIHVNSGNSGYHWPEVAGGSTNQIFISNEAHSSGKGLFGWQNSGDFHIVDFKTWRNEVGVKWGAYQNEVQFHHLLSFGNKEANYYTDENSPHIQDSQLYGEDDYPSAAGLWIGKYTLPPTPETPGREIRSTFSNHDQYDIQHNAQATCADQDSRSCTPTFNVILDTELLSEHNLRFGSDWKRLENFFDIQNWKGTEGSGLPTNFRLTRPDQPKPSSQAQHSSAYGAGFDAWVDPQPAKWPMPPTIEWVQKPAQLGSEPATFTVSGSGFLEDDGEILGNVEIWVDEGEQGKPWIAEYYDNSNLQGTPVVTLKRPDITQRYREDSVPLEGVLSPTSWSARYTKTFSTATGGEYQFAAGFNDGGRIYIDGEKVFDENWQNGRPSCCGTNALVTKQLAPGTHTIVVEFSVVNMEGTGITFDIHRILSSPTLSDSFTFDPASWDRKYAYVYARAYDPINDQYAYTEVLKYRNPYFKAAGQDVQPLPDDMTAPSVSITSPNNGAIVGTPVVIEATASDASGIAKVEFIADGNLIGIDTTAPYSHSWTAPAGSHTVEARATDASSNANTASSTIAFMVQNTPPPDTTPPAITISQPRNGATVSGSVAILAVANDSSGIEQVQFSVDGSTLHTEFEAPYQAVWSATPGTHTIRAEATDASPQANTAAAQISVTVPQPDTTPPVRSNAQPTGTLKAGTTSITLQLNTNEEAICKYAATAGTSYSSMTHAFTSLHGTEHTALATDLQNGKTYTYYTRCTDLAGNQNSEDFIIEFTVAESVTTPTLIKIEAEDMNLDEYETDRSAPEQDGTPGWIMVPENEDIGIATTLFHGGSGSYDITINVIAEDDGQAQLDFGVNDNVIESFTYPLGSTSRSAHAFELKNVELLDGDSIQLIGIRSGTAHARVDNILFKPVETSSSAVCGDNICAEAEQLSCPSDCVAVVGDGADVVSTCGTIKVLVDGETNYGYRDSDGNVVFVDSSLVERAKFLFQFSVKKLLLYEVELVCQPPGSETGYTIVKGVPLVNETKSVLVDRLTNSKLVCVKDAEVDDISDLTPSCTGENEYLVACDGAPTPDGYTCTITGEYFNVSGLHHSAIAELPS